MEQYCLSHKKLCFCKWPFCYHAPSVSWDHRYQNIYFHDEQANKNNTKQKFSCQWYPKFFCHIWAFAFVYLFVFLSLGIIGSLKIYILKLNVCHLVDYIDIYGHDAFYLFSVLPSGWIKTVNKVCRVSKEHGITGSSTDHRQHGEPHIC